MKTLTVTDHIHDTIALSEPHLPARTPEPRRTNTWQEPMPEHLIKARHHLKAILTSWALLIHEEKPVPLATDGTLWSLTTYIAEHSQWLDQHPAQPDFHTETTEACNTIRKIIDRADNRIYLGRHSGHDIYARPHQTTITLPNGEIRTVKELRAWRVHKALEYEGNAKEVAKALTLADIHVTPKQITGWWKHDRKARQQGHLPETGGLTETAMEGKQPIFKVRQVLERITSKPIDKNQQLA